MPRSIVVFLASVAVAAAQTARFEVAAVRAIAEVRPTPSGPSEGPPPPPPPPVLRTTPTGLMIDGATLQFCLQWVYGVRPWQVEGPGWIRENRYAITARTGAPVEPDQLKPMLGHLLEERFGLVIRRETKEARVTAIVIAPGGHKLKPSEPGASTERQFSPIPGGGLQIVARGSNLAILEQILSFPMWPPVVDHTGLSGAFDFTFERPPFDPAVRESWLPDIQAALRRQLGLTFAAQRAPVETIVVERGNPNPVEN